MQPDPATVLDKVFELASLLGDLMQNTLTERGLTTARAEVLLVLHRHGRPMVQRELSQALRAAPPAMSPRSSMPCRPTAG